MVLIPLADKSSRMNLTGTWRTQRPIIEYEKCIRCSICWKFCPDNAIVLESGQSVAAPNSRLLPLDIPRIDYDYCKGCGICAYECPEKCIEMELEEKD